MTKDKKGISIVVIILVLVIVAVLATTLVLVLSGGAKGEEQANSNLENEEVNTETKEEGSQEQAQGVEMWIKTVKFPETTSEFNLALFDGALKTPITLQQFENGNYIFEYNVKGKQYSVKSLKEMTQKDEGSQMIYVKDINDKSIMSVELYDIEDDSLTYYQRIQKGLWSANLYEKDFLELFEIKDDTQKEEDALLEKIAQTLGRPTHIYDFQDSFINDNSTDDSRNIAYHMMYEYDNFIVEFCVYEMIFDNNRHHVKMSYIRYYNNKQHYEEHKEDFGFTESEDILPLLAQQ